MATLSEEYQNYFAIDIDKAGLVPAYHIPTSIHQQTSPIQAMPMSPEKSLGLVGKPSHFSPVPLPAAYWPEPNPETRLQCLDHLAAAAAGIKISPNVYAPHNASPALAASMQNATASYNQSVLEKMYFHQHQQDKMQQLQYQQRQLAAHEQEQKVSLLNAAAAHPNAAAAAVAAAQLGLFAPARPSPRLPITQYLYNMYGSKYRYANPVVLQQYQGMPSPQEQWSQPINGIQKNMEVGTYDKAIRDRNNPTNVGLPTHYKSTNDLVIAVNPQPKHPSSLLTQAQSQLSQSADAIDTIDIEKLGLSPTHKTAAAACGAPPDSCVPCNETSRLLYNFGKTSGAQQNSQTCKDARNSSNSPTNNNSNRNAVKNNGGAESTNCCPTNTNGNGNNKNTSLPMSRPPPGLSGDYPGSYPSIHPSAWPSSPSTSSTPPLFATQLPTQTSFPLPASSPTATYYPYANMRNELPDPRNAAMYAYGIEDPMARMTRPRGIFSTRYHPFDRERRI